MKFDPHHAINELIQSGRIRCLVLDDEASEKKRKHILNLIRKEIVQKKKDEFHLGTILINHQKCEEHCTSSVRHTFSTTKGPSKAFASLYTTRPRNNDDRKECAQHHRCKTNVPSGNHCHCRLTKGSTSLMKCQNHYPSNHNESNEVNIEAKYKRTSTHMKEKNNHASDEKTSNTEGKSDNETSNKKQHGLLRKILLPTWIPGKIKEKLDKRRTNKAEKKPGRKSSQTRAERKEKSSEPERPKDKADKKTGKAGLLKKVLLPTWIPRKIKEKRNKRKTKKADNEGTKKDKSRAENDKVNKKTGKAGLLKKILLPTRIFGKKKEKVGDRDTGKTDNQRKSSVTSASTKLPSSNEPSKNEVHEVPNTATEISQSSEPSDSKLDDSSNKKHSDFPHKFAQPMMQLGGGCACHGCPHFPGHHQRSETSTTESIDSGKWYSRKRLKKRHRHARYSRRHLTDNSESSFTYSKNSYMGDVMFDVESTLLRKLELHSLFHKELLPLHHRFHIH